MPGAGSRRPDDSKRRPGVCAPAAPRFMKSIRAYARGAIPECATPIWAPASERIVSNSETQRFGVCISCTFFIFVRPVPAAASHDRQRSFASDPNGDGMSLPADTHAQALCHWQDAAVKDCQAREGLMRCGWHGRGAAHERAEPLESARDRDRSWLAGLRHRPPAAARRTARRGCLTVAAWHRRRRRSERWPQRGTAAAYGKLYASNLLN